MLAVFFITISQGIFVRTRGVLCGRASGGGRGWCRVGAAYVSAGLMLAKFFITISQGIFVRTRGVLCGRASGGGRGWCWVAAAYVSAGCMLAKFFITISHCPWRDFISMSVVLGRRRVAAAYVSAGFMLAIFFITISHCPWRDFISLSNGDKETKQRKRLPTICFKCPQRADHCFWFPRRTVLARATDT